MEMTVSKLLEIIEDAGMRPHDKIAIQQTDRWQPWSECHGAMALKGCKDGVDYLVLHDYKGKEDA